MNEQEYAEYQRETLKPDMIHVRDVGGRDRTLVYGYTTEGDEFHVYVETGELHVVVYREPGRRDVLIDYRAGTDLRADSLYPSKRAYPDTADRRFAEAMHRSGHALTFLGRFDFDGPIAARHTEFAVANDGFYAKRAWQL